MYHQKRGCSVFFHLEKIKKQNAFLCKFQRNLKGPPCLSQKCVDQDQNFLRTLEIQYKIFDNSHLKFRKREKAKIKK